MNGSTQFLYTKWADILCSFQRVQSPEYHLLAIGGNDMMSRSRMMFIAFAALLAAGCSAGGSEYWLYPAPYLAEPEEARFVAQNSHRVLSMDGEEINSRCTRRGARPQAYSPNDLTCQFHILPGSHTVEFQVGETNRETMSLDFDASPGKSYGLRRFGCVASLANTGHNQSCQWEVVETGE